MNKWVPVILIAGFAVISVYILSSEMADHKRLGLDAATANDLYYSGHNVIILKPDITQAAYGKNGFYWYYEGKCGIECLTIPYQKGDIQRWGAYNIKTLYFLEQYNWPTLSDYDLHHILSSEPDYLLQYDTVILLHNEYVTTEIYESVTGHPNVIYLMPNALYAQVEIKDDTISLVRGHNYPYHEIRNGFGWKHDNSAEEYDLECKAWEFRAVSNGYQLNCYPERDFIEKPEIMSEMIRLVKKPN